MADDNKKETSRIQSMTDFLKSWVMVALTLLFVSLYVATLFGWGGEAHITRLQPIVFVIIGYYFGRLPAQANENTLKNEIDRQSRKADAAQQIKEKAQQEREVLEEKIRNAQITLIEQKTKLRIPRSKGISEGGDFGENKNEAVETALKILDS